MWERSDTRGDKHEEGGRKGKMGIGDRSRDAVDAGRRAYKEINLRALKLLRPGGLLVTCSCSAHMDRASFDVMLTEAAADARRWVRVLERRSAAPDHPALATAPETDYLKVLIAEVD